MVEILHHQKDGWKLKPYINNERFTTYELVQDFFHPQSHASLQALSLARTGRRRRSGRLGWTQWPRCLKDGMYTPQMSILKDMIDMILI